MPSLLRITTAAALLVAASSALAHAKLQSAEPASGATVSAPASIKLHFNEPVEPAMSTVKVFGCDNARVEVGKPAVADGDAKTLVNTVPQLSPGTYRLEWSTMGHDGHRTKGQLNFTVR